jgi:hypothetical protein
MAELRLRSEQDIDAQIRRRQQALRDASIDEEELHKLAESPTASEVHAAMHPHTAEQHHHSGEHAPSRNPPHSTHALVHHHAEQAAAAAAAYPRKSKASKALRNGVPSAAAPGSQQHSSEADVSSDAGADIGAGGSALLGESSDEGHAMAVALNSHTHSQPFVSASTAEAARAANAQSQRALQLASSPAANPIDVRQLKQLLRTSNTAANTAEDELDDDDLQLAREEAAADAAAAAAAAAQR